MKRRPRGGSKRRRGSSSQGSNAQGGSPRPSEWVTVTSTSARYVPLSPRHSQLRYLQLRRGAGQRAGMGQRAGRGQRAGCGRRGTWCQGRRRSRRGWPGTTPQRPPVRRGAACGWEGGRRRAPAGVGGQALVLRI